MASLTGSSIASSYTSLLKLNGNTDTLVAGDGSNAIQVVDGDGTGSALYLNTDRLGIGVQPTKGLSIQSANSGEGITIKSTATEGDVQMNFFADNGDHFWTMGVDGTVDKFVIDNSSLNGTHFVILDSGNTGIGTDNPAMPLHINNSSGGRIMLHRSAQDSSSLLGSIMFGANDGDTNLAMIAAYHDGATDAGALSFETEVSGGSMAQRMRIDGNSRISLSNNDLNVGSTVFGYNALNGNTDNGSDRNTAIGYGALDGIGSTTASDNIAIGYDAIGGTMTATNNNNVAIGNYSMDAGMTNSSSNVAVGNEALGSATAITSCVAIGKGAFANVSTIVRGVAIGEGALGGAESADHSVAVGYSSMYNTTGAKNTAFGYQTANTVTSGTENTVVGYDADASASGAVNQTVIGSETTGVTDNSVTLGNASVTDVYMAQDSQAIVHAQNVPNHVCNTMASPYYRFDGTNDYVEIADSDNLSFGNGTTDKPFSVSAWIYMEDASDFSIISKGIAWTNAEWFFSVNGSDKLDFTVLDNSANAFEKAIYNTALTSYENKWIHVSATYSGVGGSSANAGTKLYLNGTEVTTTLSDSGTYVAMENTSAVAYIGRYSSDYSQGSIAGVQIHNRVLSATEVKELYSGASVAYKYKGANQTNLSTDGDMSNASSWTAGSGWSIGSGVATGSSTNNYLTQAVSLTAGKRYRLSADFTRSSGSVVMYCGASAGDETEGTTVVSSAGNHYVEFLAQSDTDTIVFTGSAFSGTIDNVELVPIGAVAEYDGSGIASDRWMDKSGNDLHGTVEGPTVENAPSGDDGLVYEEGEYTPTLSCSSSGTFGLSSGSNTFTYTKIGRKVHVQGEIQVTSESGSPSGDLRLTLPFSTAVTQTTDSSDIAIGHLQLSSSGTTLAGQLYCRTQGGLNYMTFRMRNDDCSETVLDESSVDTDFYIGINLTYNA